VDSTFRIPGTEGPDITVRTPKFGAVKVLVNEVPLRRTSRRKLLFEVPLPDGTSTELRIKNNVSGMTAEVNGTVIPLQRRLARWELVLVLAPFVLIAVGGLIGGIFAALGAGINTQVARRIGSAPARIAALIAVTVAAVGLYVATALAIAPIPRLLVGSCVNGIGGQANLSPNSYRAVDCGFPHDNEVIGETSFTGSGGFPGNDALGDFAQVPCLDAFRSYVGVDFDTSSLDMIVIVPTDVSWLKGDRVISCVALTRDGSRLTGSLKGSAR
jgi:hypothetical protein